MTRATAKQRTAKSTRATAAPQTTRQAVHHVLEAGFGHSLEGTLVSGFMIALAIANVAAGAAYSLPEVQMRYGDWIKLLDAGSAVIFAGEYFLRLWSCVELPFFAQGMPWRDRVSYAARPLQVIDLLCFVPTAIGAILNVNLWAAMLLRFVKIARYSPAVHSMARVVANERGPLFGAFVLMAGFVIFSATIMYFVERNAQPAQFGNIPAAAWWSVVTLATIGYGDAVPVTAVGKLTAGLIRIMGIAAFALPFGIIASGFSREATRRDFMVSWLLVARVPLFAGLDAAAVSQIIPLLHSRTFDAGDVIVHRGNPGDSMFFVVAGEVMVEQEAGDIALKEGDFFGEMALLEHRPRATSVRAVTRVRTLVLDRDDLERLGRRHPAIFTRIREVAASRRRAGAVPRD